MNWIRIAVGMKSDPSIHAIAAACCKSDIGKAVGHVVNVLVELPDHARDGDLVGVSDLSLEEWAVWRGKGGDFAAAFRTHLCTGTVVRGWDKHNGAPVRQADAEADRKRRSRAVQAGVPPNVPPDVPPDISPDVGWDGNGTGRDVTKINSSSTAAQQLRGALFLQHSPRGAA